MQITMQQELVNHEETARRAAESLARKRLRLVGSTPLIRTALTATRATSQSKATRKQLPAVQLLRLLNSRLSAARPTLSWYLALYPVVRMSLCLWPIYVVTSCPLSMITCCVRPCILCRM